MRPKTFALPKQILLLFSLLIHSTIQSETPIDNSLRPNILVDFNSCSAFNDGGNFSYQEFTGIESNFEQCGQVQLAHPGHVYRVRNTLNPHSCTPGVYGRVGMCIDAHAGCTYQAGDNKSLRFNVLVTPGPSGIGTLDSISFFGKAPELYELFLGETGVNNYPTRYGLRVVVDDKEIYRRDNIETSRDWSLESFHFGGIADFEIREETTFRFEILPYCPIGNGAPNIIWDIDELRIYAGCNNLYSGVISTRDDRQVCYTDAASWTKTFDVQNQFGPFSGWIVAGPNGLIVETSTSPIIDFENYRRGIFEVFHIAYDDTLMGLNAGNNINTLQGCYDLSEPIRIQVTNLRGGDLRTTTSQTTINVCNDDISANRLAVILTSNSGDFAEFFVLDRNNLIIDNNQGPNFNFESYPSGSYSIIAVSHDGDLTNNDLGSSLSNLGGCFALSNEIRIDKELVDGGSISVGGETDLSFCVGDGQSITPRPLGIIGSNFRWVVTDLNGEILDVLSNVPISLNRYSERFLELRLIAFGNDVQGLERRNSLSDIQGCFDFSNVVSIELMIADSGDILFANDEETTALCVDDGIDEQVMVSLGNSFGDSQWVILDENGQIMAISTDNIFNFEGAGPGTCYIRHVSTEGAVENLQVGSNIDDLEGCYDVSNELVVERLVRFECFGGCNVDGGDLVIESDRFCQGDGQINILIGAVENSSGNVNQFLITDEQDNIVTIFQQLPLNITNFSTGDYRLYHISSFDDVALFVGSNLNDIDHDCFDISEAESFSITDNIGGEVRESRGLSTVEVCVGDDEEDVLTFSTTGSGNNYHYVVTDDQGLILEISENADINFNDAPAGTCRVYGLAFDVDNGYSGSGTISELREDDCISLSSNFVEIIRADEGIICGEIPCEVLAGTIELNQSFFCVGDGNADLLDATITGASANWMQLIITDADSNIIETPMSLPIDLEGAEEGTCILWNLVADNPILLSPDMHISTIQDSCFMLSQGAAFERVSNNGGEVALDNGETRIEICVGDTIADILTFNTTGAGANYQYIITDDSNVILERPTNNTFNFNNAPSGICRVWGVAHNSLFTLNQGDTLRGISRPNACFDYSDNFIEVVRSEDAPICGEECLVSAGIINVADVLYCVGDGESDLVEGNILGADGDFTQILVTDADSIIVALPDSFPFDVEDAGDGTCIVWHFASRDTVSIELGANISDLDFECFDLSQGAIITRIGNNGGRVALPSGLDTITVCTSDTISDLLRFNTTGFGQNYRFVITSESNVIIGALGNGVNAFDFSQVAPGVCRVWGVAYLNDIELIAGVALSVPPDPNNCVDISENFIEVTKIDCSIEECIAEAGVISLDQDRFCVGDGELDFVVGTITGEAGNVSQLIVTDSDSLIVALPPAFGFNVEDAGVGQCIVWHLISEESISLMEGMHIDSISSDCFDISEGASFTRVQNNGGEVTLSNGDTSIDFCVSDAFTDYLVMTTTGVGSIYSYIITDENDVILEISDNDTLDFTNAPVGVCRVWGVAYEQADEYEIGDTLVELDITGRCIDVSSNFVTVNRVDSGDACDLCLEAGDNCTGDELAFIFNDTDVFVGTNVCIPLTVENFDSVAVLQGGIMWDPNQLMFTGTQGYALPSMNPFSSFNIDTLAGKTSFVWTDLSGGADPQSLNDGEAIFEICFDVIGNLGDKSIIMVTDLPTTPIQVADADSQLIDFCTNDGCIAIIESTNDVTFIAETIITMDTEVCADITVQNFVDIESVQFTLQWDSTFMCFDTLTNLNQTAGIFSSSFNSNAAADILRFSWEVGQPTLADNTVIFTVCYDIKEGNCDSTSVIQFIDDNVDIEVANTSSEVIPFVVVSGSVTLECQEINRPLIGESLDFEIYPNPVREEVQVKIMETPDDNNEINLYNSYGELVIRKSFNLNDPLQEIAVHDLPQGIYYVKLKSGDQEMTKKLLIIK